MYESVLDRPVLVGQRGQKSRKLVEIHQIKRGNTY